MQRRSGERCSCYRNCPYRAALLSAVRAAEGSRRWSSTFTYSPMNSRPDISHLRAAASPIPRREFKPADNVKWWERAVIYEIAPISFQDSNGDGRGDLPGLISRLDYLDWLGIDAVWLTPIYSS